jgi:UDP-N-acetylmuramate dehydrogenase
MFEIKENISLKNYNTFGIDVQCRYFTTCFTVEDIVSFFKTPRIQELRFMLLGGGSNVLFTQDFKGYILQPLIKGIEVVREDQNEVLVKAGAGENWDEFVEYCVEKKWGGIENLSLIPGNVGTCPIQNIGAYGVEVKDVITEVDTIEIETLEEKHFLNKECNFGYRDSVFKNKLKGKQIITHVTFCLKKHPAFKIEYGSIKDELQHFDQVNLKTIRQAVIHIRDSKLPKPEELGNSGSFFKNPVISNTHFQSLRKKYQEIPGFDLEDGSVKVPAGWLIEKAGWKGRRIGDAGVHEKQALVLINYGNATGKEIVQLAQNIQQSINKLFDIKLEMEVNLV